MMVMMVGEGRRFSGGRNHVQITGVRLKNAATGEKQEIVCDGIFVSVGRELRHE